MTQPKRKLISRSIQGDGRTVIEVDIVVDKDGIIKKWIEKPGICGEIFTWSDNKYRTKKAIPESIRWAVWERDNFTCKLCGSRKNLEIDHIHPESKGGETTIENCQTLCKRCNRSKGAR